MGVERKRTGVAIDCATPRELFTELVEAAVADIGAAPSPLAAAYLVDLLEGFVAGPAPSPRGEEGVPTLGETLLSAQHQPGALRAAMLRELGDRVLFLSGFFSASLERYGLGEGYYRQIGSAAYGGVASLIGAGRVRDGWPGVYRELSERFPLFATLMSEIGTRARPEAQEDLLRLYERFVQRGSPSDRAALLAGGVTLVDPRRWRPIQ